MFDKDALKLLYKMVLLEKKIYAYGDYNQLLPVGYNKQLDTEYFINYIFGVVNFRSDNWRNNFTNEYYYSLINGKKTYVLNEVKKYRTKTPEEADIIICYRRKTRDYYNNYMMNYLKIEYGDIGFKMVCKTNDLKQYDIYNNFLLVITDKDDNFIYCDNIKFPHDVLHEKYFIPSYAITLYGIQGDESKTFYYPDEDDFFINGRSAYTLISRIKENSCLSEKNNKIILSFD